MGGLLRNIGPGIVVSGSVVGSGELLVTTTMGAKVGFVFPLGRHRRLPGEVLHPIGTGAAVRPAQQYDHPGTGPGAWTASAEYLLGGLAVRARVFLGHDRRDRHPGVGRRSHGHSAPGDLLRYLGLRDLSGDVLPTLSWPVSGSGEDGIVAGDQLQLGRHRVGAASAGDDLRHQR